MDICGVPRVDCGCHQIGSNMELKAFLETYAGCNISSIDNPSLPFQQDNPGRGWYFTHGCFELIDHLLYLVQKSGIQLHVNCKVENIWMQPPCAIVQTAEKNYRCRKLIVTPATHCGWPPHPPIQRSSSYYHLYLLIQDPTPCRFTYLHKPLPDIPRMMNLTPFTDLAASGRQLIAIQTRKEQTLQQDQILLDALKEKQLIDASASLLRSEPYIYVSHSFPQHLIQKMEAADIVEILQTGHFESLVSHMHKWKPVLIPFSENNL